jgi:hypothetical protein
MLSLLPVLLHGFDARSVRHVNINLTHPCVERLFLACEKNTFWILLSLWEDSTDSFRKAVKLRAMPGINHYGDNDLNSILTWSPLT